ncbi:inactive peptidyl-prolyl cis-trans isomerase FKBP6 [Athalia rosae]|uniref:inactive peptidyl-prolyl cis-trans isomerase FKBP6 n=1 Tax=Athalia rosae TaxID=37344 RepID=UPI002033F3F3|nr:inactive peptidyl-prolyl cis-trans isomerase FKBP6 [Athalia rosae]
MNTQCQRGFTIAQLLKEPNMILEVGSDLNNDEEEDEIFGFTGNSKMSGADMLRFLNINDNSDDDNNDQADETIVPVGLSFESLRATMIDISGNEKVFKAVKKPGVGDVVPKDAMVTITYWGYFEYRDEPFDSSVFRQSSERIRLNQGMLIPGLDIGIQTMKKYEQSVFVINSDYAYGAMGCPPRIPPNEDVLFIVILESFIDNAAADTYESLDKEERRSLAISFPKAMAFHITANDDFNRKRIKQAIRGYKKVIQILENVHLKNQEEQDKQQKALSKAYVNLGICYNKLNEPRRACLACRNAPIPNAKAHFTHGKALMTMGEYDEAMKELHHARMMEPQNRRVIDEIKELNSKMRKYKTTEKDLWSRCLGVKKETQMTEYMTCVRNICEDFLNNPDLLRQALPAGLDEGELECIKQQAALLGLSFTKHERYGKVVFYMSKPDYESHRST